MRRYARSNSTSTIFLSDVISSPSITDINKSIALLFQSVIFEQHQVLIDDDSKVRIADYNFMIDECDADNNNAYAGISSEVLDRETENHPDLRLAILNYQVPTRESILNFLSLFQSHTGFSGGVVIVTFLYWLRFVKNPTTKITFRTWKGIWLGCLMIAQKTWLDCPIKCCDFHLVYPSIPASSFKVFEQNIWLAIVNDLSISKTQYANCYFQLRELIIRVENKVFNSSLEPLTRRDADKLLHIGTKAPNDNRLCRSMTLEDITFSGISRYILD